jgi:hypothetical protein
MSQIAKFLRPVLGGAAGLSVAQAYNNTVGADEGLQAKFLRGLPLTLMGATAATRGFPTALGKFIRPLKATGVNQTTRAFSPGRALSLFTLPTVGLTAPSIGEKAGTGINFLNNANQVMNATLDDYASSDSDNLFQHLSKNTAKGIAEGAGVPDFLKYMGKGMLLTGGGGLIGQGLGGLMASRMYRDDPTESPDERVADAEKRLRRGALMRLGFGAAGAGAGYYLWNRGLNKQASMLSRVQPAQGKQFPELLAEMLLKRRGVNPAAQATATPEELEKARRQELKNQNLFTTLQNQYQYLP